MTTFRIPNIPELRQTSLDGISPPEHGSHPVKIIKYQNYLKISMMLSEEKDKLLTEMEELQFCITDEKAENEDRQYQIYSYKPVLRENNLYWLRDKTNI